MKTVARTWLENTIEARRMFAFLGDGYEDYKAARILLRAGMPVQGAQLASTAVEKHLKAVLALQGNVSHGHLRRAHWNALKAFDPEFYSGIQVGLFELLVKCYTLRYTGSVPEDFNLVIASRELLGWLDIFAVTLQKVFTSRRNGKEQKRPFHTDLEAENEHLFAENVVLNRPDAEPIQLAQFVYARPQLVCEVRYQRRTGLYTFQYLSQDQPKDPRLDREGLRPVSDRPLSYDLSHLNVRATRHDDA
ncbi:hypothetical protein HLB44_18170 [Aquincola sp. S2]|uniref:HEPN domain-containing protein n=1 Tax=Pseudaquabacterium terrae TaxID=2732868 RepID=A0ABX2EJY9_9BURK|nr:hypothetical protein [Aquabacterium terrae]NRF68923.1 hypothetical protein [Aquabacterium terrae]